MTIGSYLRYIVYANGNKLMFAIALLLFLGAEAINTAYFRILAEYDNLIDGRYKDLSDDKDFWMVLGLLQLGFFIIMIIKYFVLNLVVLRSNETIHENMIHGLVRSPCWYFDITPSGRLTNRFSNDLGIMDNMVAFVLTESI